MIDHLSFHDMGNLFFEDLRPPEWAPSVKKVHCNFLQTSEVNGGFTISIPIHIYIYDYTYIIYHIYIYDYDTYIENIISEQMGLFLSTKSLGAIW